MVKKEIVKKNWKGVGYVQNKFANYQTTETVENLLNKIKEYEHPVFYEYIRGNYPLPLFFNIDISTTDYTDNTDETNEEIINRYNELLLKLMHETRTYLNEYKVCFYNTTSHLYAKQKIVKYSAHMIARIYYNNEEYFMKNAVEVKKFYKSAYSAEILRAIDTNLPKSGGFLLRTIYSSKSTSAFRPLLKLYLEENDELQSDSDVLYFLQYHSNPLKILDVNYKRVNSETPDLVDDKKINQNKCLDNQIESIKKKTPEREIDNEEFIGASSMVFEQIVNSLTSLLNFENITFSKIYKLKEINGIYFVSYKGVCKEYGREHTSNNPYFEITSKCVILKCHSTHCKKIFIYDTTQVFPNVLLLLLFEPSKYKSELQSYLKQHIDPGVSSIKFTGRAFEAPATSQLTHLYAGRGLINPKHLLTFYDHQLLSDQGDICTVEEFSRSKLCININNYNVTKYNFEYPDNKARAADKTECLLELLRRKDVEYRMDRGYEEFFEFIRSNRPELLAELFIKTGRAKNTIWCNKIWYVRLENIWVEDRKGDAFRTYFIVSMNRFLAPLYEYLKEISKKENYTKLECLIVKKVFGDFALRRTQSILKDMLRDNEFTEILDADLSLIPFKNGVYSLETQKFLHYDDSHYFSQYISMNYKLVSDDDAKKILGDIFIEKEDYEYAIYLLSSFIDQRKMNDQMYWFIGDGSNGKSVLLDLLLTTFGPFSFPLADSFFTRDTQSYNRANRKLTKIAKAKIAVLSEPANTTFNSNTIKRICGNDTGTGRQLYTNTRTIFRYKTKFIIAANKLPELSLYDEAIQRRFRPLNFLTKFVELPKVANERKIDVFLMEKIRNSENMKLSFIQLLLNGHFLYHTATGIQPPAPESCKFLKELIVPEQISFSSFLQRHLKHSSDSFVYAGAITELYYSTTNLPAPNPRSSEYRQRLNDIASEIARLNIGAPLDKKINQYAKTFKIKGSKPARGYKHLSLICDTESQRKVTFNLIVR